MSYGKPTISDRRYGKQDKEEMFRYATQSCGYGEIRYSRYGKTDLGKMRIRRKVAKKLRNIGRELCPNATSKEWKVDGETKWGRRKI